MKTDHLISFGIYWFLSLLQLNELQNYEEELARWNSEATLRSNTQEVPTVSFITESREISMLTKQRQVAAILEVHVTEIANQSIEQLKKYES